MNEIMTQEAIPEILQEIQEAFKDIPFGNSAFQTENFVINAALTPERAYRAIGLELISRIQALKTAQYQRAEEDIDLEEMQEKLLDSSLNKYERRRVELDIAKILDGRPYGDKLIKDALCEVSQLYGHLCKFPKYTREQFEAGESAHFIEKLQNQLKGVSGPAESLLNMGELLVNGERPVPLLLKISNKQLR